MVDQFIRRKNQQFAKDDRSLKQDWDEKIKILCDKVNNLDNYYTTSSCAGRILLLKDIKEKRDDVILNAWHSLINFDDLKSSLSKLKSDELVYFKQEPAILHVACKTLEDAQKFISLANVTAGWKRCGAITIGKRIIVEISGTEKLEFPIMHNGKLIVDDGFLKLIVKEANEKMQISWEKIEKLEKIV